MRRIVALILTAALLLSCLGSALALNYTGNIGNEATFETYTEVRESAPEAMQPFYTSLGYGTPAPYAPHPAMADYPGDTTYIYRSPDMYGYNAAVRLNTNIVVYVDQNFETKEDALAYITDLGLTAIADSFRGSVILVTPDVPYGLDSSGNKTGGFSAADQKYYYALQTAMFAINATVDGITAVDASYYGGFGFYYLIGIDGGATFLNNYVVGTLDYVGRIAGLLLINGDMERISTVAAPVPAYLVNASDATIAKYCAANGTTTAEVSAEGTLYYNQALPVRRVFAAAAEGVSRDLIENVYYNFLIKSYRGQNLKAGLNSASTPYQGYGNDQSPYSLSWRNALINGETVDGIREITVVSDALSAYKMEETGEYVQTWYEYLPVEVLDGTAPDGSIPLLLCCHGGGDDPRQYVDGQGWLRVAGEERIAIVAPEYSKVDNMTVDGRAAMGKAFPELIRIMLEKYPALDASRVYVNGYSMGSLSTVITMYSEPQLFAAAYPQAGTMSSQPLEEEIANFAEVDLPVCFSTSEYDAGVNVDSKTHYIIPDYYALVRTILSLNEIDLPEEADFDAYPITGFAADITGEYVINGEYTVHYWRFLNDDGVPMVGFNYIECIVHALYPEYASMVWDFFKHYSRDVETGAVIYNANVK